MWPSVYDASRAHLANIEALLLAGAAASPAQQLAAGGSAHRLSGSLGMFGKHEASSVAAAIESLLNMDAIPQPELRALVDRLDALLGLAPH